MFSSIANPLTTARANILARPFLAINRQPLELENPSFPTMRTKFE